ncbi:MAG: glycosyltransferase family 4 protein [Nitrospira sp.]|nr:glycosyltransferase family 4 protein [Nitrospira sp.]
MRVLFLTYPRIGLNRGGLQIQIEETARSLSKLGVDVVQYNPWKNQVPDVDVCHVFSIDCSMVDHVMRAVKLRVPVVVCPVLNMFNNHPLFSMVKQKLSVLPGVYSDLKRARIMLDAATLVLAANADEQDLLMKVFNVDQAKFRIIPNGLSMAFRDGDPQLFEEKYGVRNFVLNVASIEPRKNQLTLVRAMQRLPYTLVLVGRASPENERYFKQVKAEAGSNVQFVGSFHHDDPLLASCYRAAKLFVMPSFSEVMPLTLNEAAVAGCRILASDQVPIAETIASYVRRFRPNDVKAMARLIDDEMRDETESVIPQAIHAMPTWDQVGQQLEALYRSVVNCSEPVSLAVC